MAWPPQPSHWDSLPWACSRGLARLSGLGEGCPLTWPVGNELQLPILSVPDAFPLHRHCAVFGTQLCFVNTKWRSEKGESQKTELLSWFQSYPLTGRGEGENLSVGKFSGCSLSCLCSVERAVWVFWIQLHVWEKIIHWHRGRRKEPPSLGESHEILVSEV